MRWCGLVCVLLWCGQLMGVEPGRDPTVVVVNDEVISESRFLAGAARMVFGPFRIQQWSQRLDQLVERVAVCQQLHALDVEIASGLLDQQFEDFTTHPIPLTCGCHFYRDFADYRSQNQLTVDEAKQLIWIDLALRAYVEREWEAANPGVVGKATLIARHATALRVAYRRLWHIVVPSVDGGRSGGSRRRDLGARHRHPRSPACWRGLLRGGAGVRG